jgi:hypothetical protein
MLAKEEEEEEEEMPTEQHSGEKNNHTPLLARTHSTISPPALTRDMPSYRWLSPERLNRSPRHCLKKKKKSTSVQLLHLS